MPNLTENLVAENLVADVSIADIRKIIRSKQVGQARGTLH